MFELISYFILIFIGWITYKVYIWPYYTSPLRKIPGPPSENLLYGNLKSFFVESGEAHLKWLKKYGNFVKYHGLLNEPAIIVTDAKLIHEIVTNREFIKRKMIKGDLIRILGQSVAIVEGQTHKRQRETMKPAFAHNFVKDMVPPMVQVALKLKRLIDDEINEDESKINLSPYLFKTSLDIFGLIGFNYEFNSLTSPSEFAEAFDSYLNARMNFLYISIGILSPYIPFLRKVPIEINKRFNNACEVIERESAKIVEKKYNDRLKNEIDLIATIIRVNETLPIESQMTKKELKYQIMTITTAGHEAINSTLCWALYLLAQHPHEQDLLREELVKAFPDKSKFNLTYDEINSLEYLNCVVKEILRLYPTLSVLQRANTKDVTFGEHFIPKGTTLDIPILALHRLPSIWGPTADAFDPKRWLDPSLIKNVTNYNYLPFSAGIRFCPGHKIASIEIKVLLSVLIRNFGFQTVKEFPLKKKAGFISKPDSILKLAVSKVEI